MVAEEKFEELTKEFVLAGEIIKLGMKPDELLVLDGAEIFIPKSFFAKKLLPKGHEKMAGSVFLRASNPASNPALHRYGEIRLNYSATNRATRSLEQPKGALPD